MQFCACIKNISACLAYAPGVAHVSCGGLNIIWKYVFLKLNRTIYKQLGDVLTTWTIGWIYVVNNLESCYTIGTICGLSTTWIFIDKPIPPPNVRASKAKQVNGNTMEICYIRVQQTEQGYQSNHNRWAWYWYVLVWPLGPIHWTDKLKRDRTTKDYPGEAYNLDIEKSGPDWVWVLVFHPPKKEIRIRFAWWAKP